MTYDWTGAGKGAEFFGAADYDRALRSGKSIQDVRNYLSSSAGQASLRKTASGSVDPAVANLVETIQTGRLTSSLGQGEGAEGGLTEQAKTHFGGTDFLHATAAGHGAEAISDYMKGSQMSIGASRDLGFVHDRADSIRDYREAAQHRADEAAASKARHEQQMREMRENQRKAMEAAAKEAAKVKISGDSRVSDRAPTGIRIKSSGIGLQAARGTAQLGRTTDKTRTLNIA
tara:strand:+ start:105 stop:797 length:693 start_codon:yes stop_codon:yes gene_type:complete